MKKMMLAVAVLLGFTLMSCQKNNITPSLSPDGANKTAKAKNARPCICPDVYAPVCANGVTYSNSCEANCAGVYVFTQGECCLGKPKRNCPCPDVYAPVCGCDGQTYSNSCEATCAGVLSYTTGPCGGGIDEKKGK